MIFEQSTFSNKVRKFWPTCLRPSREKGIKMEEIYVNPKNYAIQEKIATIKYNSFT